MPKLVNGYEFMRFLKKQMDPNGILNPGVLLLGDAENEGSDHGR
jgi:FAD/FMN-containing dehydrogenase